VSKRLKSWTFRADTGQSLDDQARRSTTRAVWRRRVPFAVPSLTSWSVARQACRERPS